MAKHGAKGTSKLGRDSISKRLGIKRFGGQLVRAGEILVRQKGTRYFPGLNVKRAKDDTLYAMKSGKVVFQTTKRMRFDGKRKVAKIVHIQ